MTVERVRAAVDLEHQRLAPAAGRVEPALDLASVALPSPVDRLDPRDLLAQRDVERRQRSRRLRAASRRARLERHDLGQRRRIRADGHDEVPIPGRRRVPAGQVVAAVRQPDGLAAAVERHPPQLVRAVDRRREQDRLAVRGRDDARPLAQGHVAVEGRVGLQPALGEEVRAAARAGVGPVRREGPDPDPVVAAREPLAGDEDRGAVPRPGRARRTACRRRRRSWSPRATRRPRRTPTSDRRGPAAAAGWR